MNLIDTLATISASDPAFEPGHVWLAGAGPGHPRYLTLEVADALSKTDSIVYDALVSPEVLALATGSAELHFAGKRGGKPSETQDNITSTLIRLARSGKKVLRLKGGDPFIFGRGGEEAEALVQAGIPCRILPGMTSAIAALASARIPATMRGISRSITFTTGHAAGSEDHLDWHALARLGEPIVVYMGLKMIGEISRLLMEGGMAAQTPVAVLMAVSTPDERILLAKLETVEAEVRRQDFAAPALIVIGDIVPVRKLLTPGQRS
ncbi:uroporphyrinogen-III C-methyltransferase [Rhizobium sp. NTR19]|uniref:uroporphyrinogen-III C-methyltransferase n=1 Tax=Neorhizobium turbinariae TaxID=2937795 RepID=A0ABT0IWT2_9HYPH|nr:uroporphyrinogen-III C-methyltransferase [Neorhizobium turbinariae]MCK8782328.1 uroporphyrinogen-III C-methyltransferase [Neorhizobium turbinariae]